MLGSAPLDYDEVSYYLSSASSTVSAVEEAAQGSDIIFAGGFQEEAG